MSNSNDIQNTAESRWFEYDWHYKGNEASICVDLSYAENEAALGNILIDLRCDSKSGELNDSAYRRYERLRDKLIRKVNMCYVGLIETHSAVDFFFYAETNSVLDSIDKYIRRIADRVSCECRYDNERGFYKNTLYPDTAKLYTEENGKLIQALKERGDCVSAPRKLNFHVYFPTEPLRILFEEQARLSGYAIGECEFVPEDKNPYGTVVHKIVSLEKPDVDDATSRLIYIAEKHEGVLMFWDCVLVPKRKRL